MPEERSIAELAALLNTMYESAPRADRTTMFALFGIQYVYEIGDRARAIIDAAEIVTLREFYTREICRGMRLARYVEVKAR